MKRELIANVKEEKISQKGHACLSRMSVFNLPYAST